MALNQVHGWLVCYDIRDPRRLSRFHRFMKRQAVPVQKSVFCYQGNAAQLGRLLHGIGEMIDRKADDVRVYQLPAQPHFEGLGGRSLPDGVTIRSRVNATLPHLVANR